MAQDYADPHFEFEPPGAAHHYEVKPFWRSYLSWFIYGCLIGLIAFGLYFVFKPGVKTLDSGYTPYSDMHQTVSNSGKSSSRLAKGPLAKSKILWPAATTIVQPTFDFYTILPEGEGQNGVKTSADMMMETGNSQNTLSNVEAAITQQWHNATNEVLAAPSLKHQLAQPQETPVHQPRSIATAENAPRVEAPPPAAQTHTSRHTAKNYTVQVASFRLFRDADELRAQLLLAGYSATVQFAEDKSKASWHRVVLGPFDDRLMANSRCESIKGLGHDCLVRTSK